MPFILQETGLIVEKAPHSVPKAPLKIVEYRLDRLMFEPVLDTLVENQGEAHEVARWLNVWKKKNARRPLKVYSLYRRIERKMSPDDACLYSP